MMREWIWKALCEVIMNGTYSNLYLKDHLQELPKKDQALASRIFYGTLQNYDYCQAAWKPYARNKVTKKLQILLTMSCYQLLFLDKVPAYAVINDAVKLAKKEFAKQAGFVNAVLRRVSENKVKLPSDTLERLALQTSLPVWLIKMWDSQYGFETAKKVAKSSLAILPVYVRVNPIKMDQDELQEAVDAGKLTETDEPDIYIYNGDTLGNDILYRQGKISAMDPGSYQIAIFGSPKKSEKILDLCAAPGTKSMAMAEAMDNTGSIDAYDLHEHRVKLIENDAKRLGLDIVHAKQGDSTRLEPKPEEEKYDLVLCDVPCSGYGVLARKPDMKLHLDAKDIDSLIPIQKELLEAGARDVKEGGRLVYSTCTINKKENEKQVEAFLKGHPEFRLEQELTVLPDDKQGGFYMARLERSQK